jgi:hypothetical protein
MHDETASDAGLSYSDEIKREMFEAIDRLKVEIRTRFEQVKEVNDRFGFLQLGSLLESHNDSEKDEKVDDLAALYDEINGDDLKREIRRLRRLLLLSESEEHNKKLAVDKSSTLQTLLEMDCQVGIH